MSQPQNTETPSGFVKKSTFIGCVLFALVAGLYSGYLLGGINADSKANPTVQPPAKMQSKSPTEDPEFIRFQQAVDANPKNPEAWNHLGHWYFDHGMPRDAIKSYENSLSLKADDPNIITNMGVMFRELHDHEKALELFRQASSLDKNHMQSRFNQGVVLYFDLNRKDEGLKVWSELLDAVPDYRAPNGAYLSDMLNDLAKGR